MDDVRRLIAGSLTAPPHLKARYRPSLWEPLPGTGERIVALVSVEPEPGLHLDLEAATYPVLSQDRLRAILGRRRGDAAFGVLHECASFMSDKQSAGVTLDDLRPLFTGFTLGPILRAHAYSVEQLLNAAVRTVSAFGSADDILIEAEQPQRPQTRRTAEFLREVRRIMVDDDDGKLQRFHVRLQREQTAPDVWVDYAQGPRVVQAASVPGSVRQVHPAESELKAKLLDLEIVRREFQSNTFRPALLLNVRALEEQLPDDSLKVAREAHDLFRRYAAWAKVPTIDRKSVV